MINSHKTLIKTALFLMMFTSIFYACSSNDKENTQATDSTQVTEVQADDEAEYEYTGNDFGLRDGADEIAEKEKELAASQKRVAEIEKDNAEKEKIIAKQEKELAEAEKELAEVKKENAEKRKEIERLKGE